MTSRLRSIPLRDRTADSLLFVPPDGFERAQTAALHNLNVLVLAPRGGGKTSALHQLELRLRDDGAPPVVFADLAGVDAPHAALQTLVALASESIGADVLWKPPPARPHEADEDLAARTAIRQLAGLTACRFLIDNASAEKVAYPLFGTFRDRLWDTPHQWILAAALHDRGRLLRPPADAFWEEVVDLSLTQSQAHDLLVRRIEGTAPWAQALVGELGTTNPRQLIRAALAATIHPDGPEAVVATRRRLQEQVDRLGERPAILLEELRSRGPVSASDPELLDRLGWARTTVLRALDDLVEAGLVQTYEQPQGRGRPRRLFAPVDADA
ncbi:MAG TPA: hypothetical protein VF712_15985 [Thermoleophilaceae bacterium]|jgi:hypothetical protein